MGPRAGSNLRPHRFGYLRSNSMLLPAIVSVLSCGAEFLHPYRCPKAASRC